MLKESPRVLGEGLRRHTVLALKTITRGPALRSLYLQVHELVSKEVNVPEPYLKPVQAFVQLQQTYESPLKAATALSKNVGPKKRQAKAKPGAEAKRQKS